MQNRDQMHPQDMRNLIIFAVISITMWLGYDMFVARPNAEAMRIAAAKAKIEATTNVPSEILDTAIVKPIDDVLSENARVKIETPSVTGTINLKGARLDDLRLNDYFKTVEKIEHVHVLSPARTAFPRYVETGWTGVQGSTGLPDANTVWRVKAGSDTLLTPQTPVTLTTTNGSGVTFERTFKIDDDFGINIENRVVNNSGNALILYPYALITEHGIPEDFGNMRTSHEGPIAYVGEELHERDYKDFEKRPQVSFNGTAGWIGLTTKYWLTSIAPPQGEETRYRFTGSAAVNEETKTRYQADVVGAPREVAAGGETSYAVNIFSGAKRLNLLTKYEKEWGIPHFDLAVDFGWFYFLTKPFLIALSFLYGIVGNFGIAIILFTCVLRIFVFPLANISYKSFAKMRQVAPEMYELRQKYNDDKPKLQQELVALYQRHKVNPAAGCLPILVQIPIFFALYKVLSNTIEMRHAPFFGWIEDLSVKDPTSFFNLFGLLPYDAPSFLVIGAWPCMMLVAMIIQKNISPPPDDPIQARIIGLMPWFMTWIMSGFAAGLVIYWTVNAILAVVQQVIIMKRMGVEIHLFKDKQKEKLEQAIAEGPSVHPALEIIEGEFEKVVHPDEDGPKEISAPKAGKKKKK